MQAADSEITISADAYARNIKKAELGLPNVAEMEIPLPYLNPIPPEEHRRIKRDICLFLIDNDIVDIGRLNSVFSAHLNLDEWKEVEPRPEDYWYIVAANQLIDPDTQRKFGRYLLEKGVFAQRKKLIHYNLNQMVWVGRAVELHSLVFNEKPDLDFLNDEIKAKIAPRYCAFYAMKTGTGKRVNYISKKGIVHIESYKKLLRKH